MYYRFPLRCLLLALPGTAFVCAPEATLQVGGLDSTRRYARPAVAARKCLASVLGACLLLASGPAKAAIDHTIKLNQVGYRPGDVKVAIFTVDPGATVEIRNTADTAVFTIPDDGGQITFKGFDQPSGDTVWWVDFSAFATPGTYHLHSVDSSGDSYDFEIDRDVYNAVGRTALRTFYLQRCNTPKEHAYAGDWADGKACHLSDAATDPAPGETDYGTLDLTGGWHDAGDYNKYVWGAVSSAVHKMLRAYEDNPGVFPDRHLNIPESGNGIPDILDEIRVELDWLLKMQLDADTNPLVPPADDGAVLHQMHVAGHASDSPPSADANARYYHDLIVDAEEDLIDDTEGDLIYESTAVLGGVMAHAARVWAAEGLTAEAATFEAAALDAWRWLQSKLPCTDTPERCKILVWAAAEVFRTDPTQTVARDYVDSFHHDWANHCLNPTHYDSYAAITYIQTPAATPSVVRDMKAGIINTLNWCVFPEDDLYRNGMPSYSYHWGSNAPRADHGLFLLSAAKLGLIPAGMTADELRDEAQDYLHYFLGQNPLNMVYLTNMTSLGGEHSSWQFYHAWFGDSRSSYSRANFIGKPPLVAEPDYPYYKGTDNMGVSDDNSSTHGSAPGFVVGGPNPGYEGNASPPLNSGRDQLYYRDWCEQRHDVWPDLRARTWQITESSIGYQGPFVALASYFMTDFNPACMLTLSGQTVSTTETYTSCGSISAGPDFRIVAPGDVELRAATHIVLRQGFSIGLGARFTAEIDPTLENPSEVAPQTGAP